MSRHFRVERLPSGIYLPGPPTKILYQPQVHGNINQDAEIFNVTHRSLDSTLPFFPGTRLFKKGETRQQSTPEARLGVQPIQEEEQRTLCLPLLQVSVEVTVDGTVAHTVLTQYFKNASNGSIPEAHYTFPLYDGAVITSLRYHVGGRVVVGEVRAKEEAREEFQRAVKKKQAAVLLEEHTPEVFETAISNIPTNDTVKVEIEYVSELRVSILDEGSEGLDVVIPMSVAPRYGTSFGNSGTRFEDDGLEIVVKVNHSGAIQDLRSPTHRNRVKVSKNVTSDMAEARTFDQLGTEAAATQIIAVYESKISIMDEDFVLCIEMLPSNPLRSHAILSTANKEGQAALMVKINPSEIFKSDYQSQNFEGEIIFVLDRSGSMDWSSSNAYGHNGHVSKIETIRRAMPLSLTSLPSNCAFNIVSFGSHSMFLWDTSQPYSDETRKYATEFTKTVRADMGGTELLFALQKAVESRLANRRSTQIIIITDGEVEAEATIDYVRKTRLELEGQIRFFALGIGDQVSHRLIESIGEFGGGHGEVVNLRANPKWEGHLSRMLRSGVTPDSWNIDLDLGAGFERRSLLTYELGGELQDKQISPYIQAPYPSLSLHPFRYQSTFFLLDLRSNTPPSRVSLRPTNAGIKPGIEHYLDVQPTLSNRSAIHHLAAKAILTSLQSEMNQDNSEGWTDHVGCFNAQKLGITYSIASKWTSFIAIDQEDQSLNDILVSKAEMIEINVHDHRLLAPIPITSNPGPSTNHFSPNLMFDGHLKRYRDHDFFPRPLCIDPKKEDFDHLIEPNFYPSTEKRSDRRSRPRSKSPILASKSCEEIISGGDPLTDMASVQGSVQGSSGRGSFQAPTVSREAKRQRQSDSGVLDIAGVLSVPKNTDEMQGTHDDFVLNFEEYAWQDLAHIGTNDRREDLNPTWAIFIDAQNSSGLFRLSEPSNKTMQEHYCSGTPAALEMILAQHSTALSLSNNMRNAVIDTLMTIQYFEVHLAKEKELWEMMIDKAEYAVGQALQISNEEEDNVFAALKHIVDGGSKHKHFLAVREELASGSFGPFPPSDADDACPSCGAKSQVESLQPSDKQPSSSTEFRCPLEDCETSGTSWERWDDLWKHQVESGHVLCGRH